MQKHTTQIMERLISASDFRALGEDEQGIPRYCSIHKGVPPRYVCWIGIAGGILLLSFGILVVARVPVIFDNSFLLLTGMLSFLGGIASIGYGLWMWKIRWRFASYSSSEQICSQLGIIREEMDQLVKQKGIKPSCNINGSDYYNLTDFSDATSLLRASQQPTAAPETLLRPAAYAETPQEQLLRAAPAMTAEATGVLRSRQK